MSADSINAHKQVVLPVKQGCVCITADDKLCVHGLVVAGGPGACATCHAMLQELGTGPGDDRITVFKAPGRDRLVKRYYNSITCIHQYLLEQPCERCSDQLLLISHLTLGAPLPGEPVTLPVVGAYVVTHTDATHCVHQVDVGTDDCARCTDLMGDLAAGAALPARVRLFARGGYLVYDDPLVCIHGHSFGGGCQGCAVLLDELRRVTVSSSVKDAPDAIPADLSCVGSTVPHPTLGMKEACSLCHPRKTPSVAGL